MSDPQFGIGNLGNPPSSSSGSVSGGNGLGSGFNFSAPANFGDGQGQAQGNLFSFAGAHVTDGGAGAVPTSAFASSSSSSSSSGAGAGMEAGAFWAGGGAFGSVSGGGEGGGGGEDRKRGSTDVLDIDDILGMITEKMHGLSTGHSGDMHVEMLNVFMEVLDVESAMAQFYLESAGWDIQVAVSLCMETLQMSRPQHHQHHHHHHRSQKRRSMDYKPREVIIEGLPVGWSARVSRHTGDIYFVNNATNAMQSSVPPGFADADTPLEEVGDMQQDDGAGAAPAHGNGDAAAAAAAAAAAMHEAEAYGGGGGGGSEGNGVASFGLDSAAGFDGLEGAPAGGGEASNEVDMA